MCGIAGVLYADRGRIADEEVLRAMGDAIAHRGPDAAGYWQAPGVGLVHRRLSIIDLAGGDQPIGNEDGSLQVVFNGEIYNYRSIRKRLIDRGHKLATNSDTEVLVHLYEDLGDSFVEQLRGMFAFALWDSRRRRMVFARDRVGQKPLYFYCDSEKFVFASELKAILAHPDVDRSIDCEAVEDYLTFGMIPGSHSIFKRIRKLPAAHVASISVDEFRFHSRRYWQFEPRTDHDRSVEDWQEAIRAKLEETVTAHMIADVPVGAFLSGGVDSSVVVATASQWGQQSVATFGIGFREAAFNELPYAEEVATTFRCPFTSQTVTCQAVQGLDDLVQYYDEPFADSSALPTLQLARLAREHVKVALSGDGGDEAFGGYSRYAHDLQEARWRQLVPARMRRTVVSALAGAWPAADWLPRPLRAKTRLTNLSLTPADAYANTLTWCRTPLRRRLLSGDVGRELNGYCPEDLVRHYYNRANPADPLSGMIAADIGVLLPDDFLTKVDRASMAWGLEVRPPLVDHELLELAGTIPSALKVRGHETKWIFKQAYGQRLPAAVTERPKQGFDVPVDAWLRGPLRDLFDSAVLSPRARIAQLVDQRTADGLFRRHQSGVGRHGNLLWALLVLGRWAEKWS